MLKYHDDARYTKTARRGNLPWPKVDTIMIFEPQDIIGGGVQIWWWWSSSCNLFYRISQNSIPMCGEGYQLMLFCHKFSFTYKFAFSFTRLEHFFCGYFPCVTIICAIKHYRDTITYAYSFFQNRIFGRGPNKRASLCSKLGLLANYLNSLILSAWSYEIHTLAMYK